MGKGEEDAFYDVEGLPERNNYLSEEVLNYKKLNSELQKIVLAQVKIIENKNFRIDELESQIQLLYKEQLDDFANLTEHLKLSLSNQIAETNCWKHKYEVLASSKLGRFTLKYWEYRSKFKTKVKGNK